MSIITISRGSYSQGATVATKLAAKLGYECISREVLLEASKDFNIPEIKLVQAISDAPSILDRFIYGKEKYIAFIQAAILKHVLKDNVVYHGMAGHFFMKGISHLCKVRILAKLDDRVKRSMEQEGLSYSEALSILKRTDEERRKWSKNLYGIDTTNSSLYDLVIHTARISADDAMEIIACTVRLPQFQTTPESQKALEDLALAAMVKALLVDRKPDAEVTAKEGIVQIVIKMTEYERSNLVSDLEKIAKNVPGVEKVEFRVPSKDS